MASLVNDIEAYRSFTDLAKDSCDRSRRRRKIGNGFGVKKAKLGKVHLVFFPIVRISREIR